MAPGPDCAWHASALHLMSSSSVSLSYGPHHLHQLDLYFSSKHDQLSPPPPLICYIHGGAWRSEDKSLHSQIAVQLVNLFDCAVAIPNYRLSPFFTAPEQPVRHPAHAEDILAALNYLRAQDATSPHSEIAGRYDPSNIHLVCHSCSAHMLCSIFLDSSHVTPSLTPTASLLSAIRSIICSEGIYDLDILISSFPAYREWFILAAFGQHDSYLPYSVATYDLRDSSAHIRWLVVQSPEDTLIDSAQANVFRDHLLRLRQHAGIHFEFDDKTLTGDHDDIPRSEDFYKMIVEFVKQSQ